MTESSAFAPPNSCLSAALPKLDQAAGSCGERSNRLHAHPGEDLRELTPKPRSKEKHDNLTCCFLGISWLSTLCCFIPLQILILSYSNLTRWCVVTPGNTWESFTASPPCKAISTNWLAGGRFASRRSQIVKRTLCHTMPFQELYAQANPKLNALKRQMCLANAGLDN
jgi:hypothetical protein